jgi:amino acid adenylation domain-containing protein/FkbM family methyltransferase
MEGVRTDISPEQLSTLAQRLARRNRPATIPRRGPVQDEPLSFAQQRLWFVHQLLPDIPLYQVPALLPFDSNVNAEVLRNCLLELAERHEILRTTFPEVAGLPVQRVHASLDLDFNVVDLCDLVQTARQATWASIASEQMRQPFDPAGGPLFRAVLYRLASEECVLLIVMHHMISDGWSISILLSELAQLYAARMTAQSPNLRELPIQYADFAAWQRERLGSGTWDAQIDYWRRQLSDLPPSPLPGTPDHPAFPSYQGATRNFTVPRSVAEGLRAIAQRDGVTLFMTLIAAFKVLLCRHSGISDVIVGTPIAGRTRPELEPLIGCFVNPLVLRTDLSGNPPFSELLQRVKEVTLAAYANQDVPFEKVVEELQPDRSSTRNPLFQVAFTLQSAAELPAANSPELVVGTAKFDLYLGITETARGLAATWEYDKDLFDDPAINRLTSSFVALLSGIAARPARRLSELPLPPDDEHSLTLWNSTAVEFDRESCVHHIFETAVNRWPTRVAVKCADAAISYQDLNRRADVLARRLAGAGVVKGSLVGIFCGRSIDFVLAMLAVLKAGGAYVPIDPDYPAQRVRLMLEGMNGPVLLTQKALAPQLMEFECRVVLIDLPGTDDDRENQGPLVSVGHDDLAYAIYTSGSTGQPKLAGVNHGGLANLLNWFVREFQLGEEDRSLVVTSPSFDLTQKNLLGPLLVGAEVHLAPAGEFDPGRIVDSIGTERVTLLNCTPSIFYALCDGAERRRSALATLRYVLLGGEPIIRQRLKNLVRFPGFHAEIVNTYGPTECTDVVAFHRLSRLDAFAEGRVPIGRPVDNVRLYILGENLERLPIGAPGELCIAGTAVGAGYLNDTTLTAERFVADPYSQSDQRLYRTGDRARYFPDGSIDFLGRSDHQIKLRGFRVEVGEIETTLRTHPAVKDVVIVPSPSAEGQLVALVVPEPDWSVPLANFIRMERDGTLHGHATQELANGMLVVHQNRSETEFVYREVFEERAYFRHGIGLRPGATVFDVGANIGLFTLFLARLEPSATIYAFEPIPSVFSTLQLNAKAYSANVHLFQTGLSNASGTAEFHHYPHASILSGRYASQDEDRATVKKFLKAQATSDAGPELSDDDMNELLEQRLQSEHHIVNLETLSETIRRERVAEIDLLKIDVEKSELEVLQGIESAHWPLIRQVVIEVHDVDGRLDHVIRLLNRNNFLIEVEQDCLLETSGMFNVYARRPEFAGLYAVGIEKESSSFGVADDHGWKGPETLKSELRACLKTKLPGYMIPNFIVFLECLPTTPSGKLDRKALTKIMADHLDNRSTFVAPRTELERQIAAIWSDVLGIDRIGISDNFFDLGGHSLMATQVVARLRDNFQVEFPLRHVFETPTIAGLCGALVEELLKSENSRGSELAQSA